MTQEVQAIGIIGAGKLAIVLSQLAIAAGYQVYIAGSGDPEKIRLSVDVLTPGAVATYSEEVAQKSEVVILALPLAKFRQLPVATLSGKVVIDAMNYWWEVDGPRDEILPDYQSSSEAVQELLTESRVVKAFSHLGYHDLYDGARLRVISGKKAVAIAGNDTDAVTTVASLIECLGFNPLFIGSLSQGVHLEPGSPAFGASVSRDELQALIARTSQ